MKEKVKKTYFIQSYPCVSVLIKWMMTWMMMTTMMMMTIKR